MESPTGFRWVLHATDNGEVMESVCSQQDLVTAIGKWPDSESDTATLPVVTGGLVIYFGQRCSERIPEPSPPLDTLESIREEFQSNDGYDMEDDVTNLRSTVRRLLDYLAEKEGK